MSGEGQRKRFGERAIGNYLSGRDLKKPGTLDVTISETVVIPPNDQKDIAERDGLSLTLPDGSERILPLNARNTKALLDAVPSATETDGGALVGVRLTLAYAPGVGPQGQDGVTIAKVHPRA